MKEIKIRTDNSEKGINDITCLWNRVLSCGEEFSPQLNEIFISKYSNYEDREFGKYDYTIMISKKDFLNELDEKVREGKYIRYHFSGETIEKSAIETWKKIWEDSGEKRIERAYIEDYQIDIPEVFSEEKKAHTTVYIGIK